MRGALCRWVAPVVLAVVAAGCGDAAAKSRRSEGDKPAAQAERRVELVRARAVPLAERIEIAGTLAAQDQVAVRTKVAGRLASIAVDLGSPVRAGQVIAEIESIDYRLRVEQAVAALGQAKALLGLAPDDEQGAVVVDETTGVRQARATLEEARANFERSQTLVDKKLIGRADFDAVNATFLRAQSELARAREEVYNRLAVLKQRRAELALVRQQLTDATIRAPLDGVVQSRGASAGEFLAQGAVVATVVRIDPLRLRVEVPERDAVRVALGQDVQLRLDESERVYTGRVARLSPTLNQQNRTLVVEAEIPNPGELRPGSFARAVISLGSGAPVVTLPSSAVVVFAGIEKVITVQDGKAVEKQIETGRRAGQLVEVVKGLADGEAVVLEPGTLQQGQPVQVTGERNGTNAALKGRERESRVE